jgi:2-polyprenyl-3-methyl-5-hydroxy-6-metoxy-1,4-benzoquinol methylase
VANTLGSGARGPLRPVHFSPAQPLPLATSASYRKGLHSLEPWRGKGRLLNLGCDQGYLLVEAAATHWHATGMEFAEAAICFCRQRGLDVIQRASAAHALSERRFEVVTAFEVLEHLRTPGDLLCGVSIFLIVVALCTS